MRSGVIEEPFVLQGAYLGSREFDGLRRQRFELSEAFRRDLGERDVGLDLVQFGLDLVQ